MAKIEVVTYSCDRCGVDMPKPRREIAINHDISELWKPATWGKTQSVKIELCDKCFSSFCNWKDNRD